MLVVGPIQANCYLLGCERTKEAAVIDPGGDVDKILVTLAKDKLHSVYIINTHGHFDHTGDNKRLKEVTGAKLVIHRADAPMILQQGSNGTMWGMEVEDSPPPDVYVEERDVITFGDISLQVLHTPGHSPGGISLLSDKMVFVGDTLFGRIDRQNRSSWRRLRNTDSKRQGKDFSFGRRRRHLSGARAKDNRRS